MLSRPQTGKLRIVRRLSDRKLFLYDRLVVPGTRGWMNLRWRVDGASRPTFPGAAQFLLAVRAW